MTDCSWKKPDKQYKIWMYFQEGKFLYGTYDDKHQANEIAMEVRTERGCDTYVEEVDADEEWRRRLP